MMAMLKRLEVSVIVWLGFVIFSASFQEQQDRDVDEIEEFEGHKVFNVYPQTQDQVDVLQQMMLTQVELDFWAEPSRSGDVVTFTAPKESLVDVRHKLKASGLRYDENIRNIEDEVRPVLESLVQRRSDIKGFNLDEFNKLEDINAYLNRLAASCPNDIRCELYSIGKSYEKRNISVFKISKDDYRGRGRKGFWIDATIHAREWLTTATALKILNHLISRPDSTARRLVNTYDWYIAPVLNPDGFVFTFKQRFWRKNRRRFTNTTCVGVDLNRNFNFRWGTEGVSHDACSLTYCGPKAGSEPEVEAVQKEARRLGSSLLGWITLHAYGRMWMFPYGSSVNHEGKICERTDDYDDLMEVANAAADAVAKTYSTVWARGTTCEVVYANSGSSLGYVRDIAGVKYSYGIELRGKSFSVNASQINPSFVEIWNGLVAMCDAIEVQRNRSSNPTIGRFNKGAILASLFFRWLGRGVG